MLKTTKSFIKHELLNIFTIINLFTSDGELGKKEILRISELIRLATILVSYENILSGESPKLFFEKVNIFSVIEILTSVYDEKIKENNIDIILPKDSFNIIGDKHYIRSTFDQIIKKLLNHYSRISFNLDHKTNSLNISFSGDSAVQLSKKNLKDSLTKPDLESGELGFQLALKILDLHNMKYIFQKNKMIIKFNQKI